MRYESANGSVYESEDEVVQQWVAISLMCEGYDTLVNISAGFDENWFWDCIWKPLVMDTIPAGWLRENSPDDYHSLYCEEVDE